MWTKKLLITASNINAGQNAMLEALRDYFVNNTLISFEIVTDTIESGTSYADRLIELKHNNIKLQFKYNSATSNAALSVTSYLILQDDTLINLGSFTITDYVGIITTDSLNTYSRSLSIFIIKNNDSFIIRFIPQNDKYASVNGKHIAYINCNVVDDTLSYSDDVVAFVTSSTVKTIKRLQDDNACAFAVSHTALKNNKLIVENKLSVTDNNGYFIEETSDVVGLIGAEMHKFYQTENGTYFCFNTDMAMIMSEEVTSNVT